MLFAQSVVSAIGEIKYTVAGEKNQNSDKNDGTSVTQKVSNSLGGLFGKKDKITPPPIPVVAYYVVIDGKQKGPYDLTKLRKMLSEGLFSEDSLVWKEGMESWVQASEVVNLQPLFQIKAPPISSVGAAE